MNGVIRELPADVWVDILRRIPATVLFPLKAVCKTFHRLISNDFFTQLHLKTLDFTKATRAIISTDANPKIISNYDPDKRKINDEPSFGYWPCNHVHHSQVIDSYHGLLLVQICDRLLLCNPVTRSYKFLSASNCDEYDLLRDSGCCKIAKDDEQYKVFGLRKTKKRPVSVSVYVFDVHRYDGELHPPREIMATERDSQITGVSLIKQSVLVNGNVHWLIITLKTLPVLTQEICVVSANVSTEEVKTRSCYSTPFLEGGEYNFFAANGTFYLVLGSYYANYLKLWVLEGVESENPNPSWKTKHYIPIFRVPSTFTKTYVLGMLRNKILIMIEGIDNRDRLIYQYDISSWEFEEVTVVRDSGNFKRGKRSFESFRIVEHIDSLISLEADLGNAAN